MRSPLVWGILFGILSVGSSLWGFWAYQRLMRKFRESENFAGTKVGRLVIMELCFQWDRILSEYRRINYDFGQAARHPLLTNSWPKFGEPWQFLHARLYCLKEEAKLLRSSSEVILAQLNWSDWSDAVLPTIREDTVMVDYLAELQEFRDYLSAKVPPIANSISS